MNDIRRVLLWVVFAVSLIMLWDHWQVYNGRPASFFPQRPTATSAASAPLSSVPPPLASASGAAGEATVTPGVPPSAMPATAHERVEVSTDVLRLTFDTEGGSLVKSEFLQYDEAGNKGHPLVLFDNSAARVYMAQTGLIGGDFPTHKTLMHFSGERQLADGQNQLVLKFESEPVGGVQLVKTYTLTRGSYAIGVRHEVINAGGAPAAPQLYLQLVRDGGKPPGESSFYSTFTGPAVYSEEGKFQKVDFKDIEKNKTSFTQKAASGYVAMVQHYFASAWVPASGAQRENFARKVSENLYAVGMIEPLGSIAAGGSKTLEATLVVGPQREKMLESISPGLGLVKDYGILAIISKPLYWLLDHLHDLLGNWGWSIVALVLLIKIAFFWLNAKGYASMAKMKAVNPRIMEMRERLKDNPQEMQKEMMRIYREEKVNPLKGCLPIAIPIPVFIALYYVLLSTVEMRGAPWVWWIHDLSASDPYYILPIIMMLSMVLQTALNPAPPDPMQAKMMWIMPLAFSFMFFFFPSGLVLYYVTNNLLSIAQQWIINRRMGVPVKFSLPKFR